jgi:hypothetical protein
MLRCGNYVRLHKKQETKIVHNIKNWKDAQNMYKMQKQVMKLTTETL